MSDYKVGYGRPPAHTRFQTGSSGNPGGRQKGSKNISTMVMAALGEMVWVNIDGQRKRVSKLQAAFIQQSNKAAGGDAKAIKLMLDILGAAQSRDAAQPGDDDMTPDARRTRHKQVLVALKAQLRAAEGGGEDDAER